MTTFFAKPGQVDRKWFVIDATDKTLGRLATEVAVLLRGKHKPIFTPFVDTGDHVIIVNADKVKLTGKKLQQKQYIRHSGYPGGLKTMSYQTLLQRNPEKAVYAAVQGMIPHNRLGRQALKKLRVYRGATHPHQSQQPQAWPLEA
ncbi:MAG: 50S ribosomal protein L13 [Bacillota bacterium]